MKFVVILIVAGILLAGCEAKPGKKGKSRRPKSHDKSENSHCTPLSQLVGYTGHHDIMHAGELIKCYEEHGYDPCNQNMDIEQMEDIMHSCEDEIKAVINDISDLVGRKPANWEEELFSLERHARRTGTRGTGTRGTGTRGTGTRVSSVCRDFSSNVISFLNSIRSSLPSIVREVGSCFSGSRGDLATCLFNFFTEFIAPFLTNAFVRCILSLFGV